MRKLWKVATVIALLLAALAMLSGCTTNNPAEITPLPTPNLAPTVMEAPNPTEPAAGALPGTGAANLNITVDGRALTERGVDRDRAAWLPLKAVAEALGHRVTEDEPGTAPGAAQNRRITITPQGAGGEPVEVTYRVGAGDAVTEASIARTGMTQTLTNPLMMVDNTLYAAEKVFTEALNAHVTYDAGARTVTVTKGTAP
ncbi:MAG: copper amine oxidase N-terminal domain-containing protein [Clostridia bacterium]|nr:copper amine oxidase N-terminal domain-containing protein [Clostridia bacterium]